MIQRVLVISLLFWTAQARAQGFTHFLSTDTIAYEVGDNIPVVQEWSHKSDDELTGPELPPSLGKLEKLSEEDLIVNEVDGRVTFRRKATYTCFDTGYYQIPGLAWQVKGDSVVSNPLILQIHLVEVDTAQDIKDIEPPLSIPYTFKEVAPYLFGGLGIMLVAILVIFWIVRSGKRNNESLKPQLPAYVVAYEKLEILKSRRLWQKGEHKEYHFELSAILREYIHGKFHVASQELTTEELYTLCQTLNIEDSILQEIFVAMRLGDLAKFAKAIPSDEQNEEAWKSVYDFVSQTQDQEEPETDFSNGTTENKQIRKPYAPKAVVYGKRREMLPLWIKFFIWFYMIVACSAILEWIPGISLFELSFELNKEAVSFNPYRIYGLSSNDSYSLMALAIMLIFALKGMVGFTLWTGKTWAVKLGLVDAVLGIVLCVVSLIEVPFFLNTEDSFRFNPRIEIFFLIPYLILLIKKRTRWENWVKPLEPHKTVTSRND